MKKFPVIKLFGSPTEIGQMHGQLLRNEILETIEYYMKLFQKKDSVIQVLTAEFKKTSLNSILSIIWKLR